MDRLTVIVGGGISGITAAVELAEAGSHVAVVEREPYLGGKVNRFSNYFPKLCPPSCGLEINYSRIRSNPRISYYTGAEVTRVSGEHGNFTIHIRLAPRLIDNRCTACGKCAGVCPESAAYMPHGLSFPMKYSIDPERCQGISCSKCLEVCESDAIHLDAGPADIQLSAHRVIMASGWEPYDASRLEGLGYSEEPDVVTNLEFEDMLAGCVREDRPLARPSDGKTPASVAFVQCAGSRDVNHLPYCSAVCCSASLKHALVLAGKPHEIRSELFYIDLRVQGRNEKVLGRAEASDLIRLTRGKAGRISRSGDGLVVEVEDSLSGRRRQDVFDLVVLAVGLVPNRIQGKAVTDAAGFCGGEQVRGLIPAGTCKRPMDVSSAVRDATAASLKSIQE